MIAVFGLKSKCKVIVGLGNPGEAYKRTRHNAGARAVEKLAKEKRFLFRLSRPLKSLVAVGKIQNREVFFVLPQTFMNLSGNAVLSLVKKKRVLLDHVLIVCDDVALPLGEIKIKSKGSGGGHNGLASVIEKLGTKDFARLRLGIGRGDDRRDLSDYVLSRFTKDEEPVLEKMLDKAVLAIETWVLDGVDKSMNCFNQTKA